MSSNKVWNSLEVAKLLVSILTPMLLFWLGYEISENTKQSETALWRIENERAITKSKKIAVNNLAVGIYERRVRAELLASSIKRNISTDEIILRKTQYDDAYFRWNRDHKANLLSVRSVLEEESYTDFESMIEVHIVNNIFAPLDRCLTNAYDYRITSEESGYDILVTCDARKMIQAALDCGYAVTDQLFKLTEYPDAERRTTAKSIVSQVCQ